MKKNRILSLLCAGIMALTVITIPMRATDRTISIPAAAEETEIKTYQDFEYTVSKWDTVEIVGYTGTSTNVTIPNTISGKRVDSIGMLAFYGNEKIESITFYSNMSNIPEGAFRGCTSLHNFYCSSNKDFSFSGGVLYYKVPIEDGFSISTSEYPSTITYHKVALFCAKDSQYITLLDGTDKIADYAFMNLEKLTHIVIPAGVQYIGYNAFYGCSKLRAMSMTSGEESSSEFNIPYGTIVIENKAFFGCEEIRTVSFPSTLEYIGNHAFANCPHLKSAYIPDNIVKVGNCAFGYSTEEWEDGHMTSMGNPAFTIIYDSETDENGDKTGALRYAESNYMNRTTSSGYQGGGLADDGTYQIIDAYGNVITVGMNVTHDPNNDFDHNYVYTAVVPVTCTTPGSIAGICYCGHTFYQEFPAHGHSFTEEVTVPPTCTEDGYQGMKCIFCDTVYESSGSSVSAILIPDKKIIPALGHSYGTPIYEWSEDHTACTAKSYCEHDDSHILMDNGTVTSKKDGDTTIYTASFANKHFTTQTVKVKDGTVVQEPATGDANGDGEFNVSDVVILQKWLLAVPDTQFADWRAANFYPDDRLDVFDLCLMKRALIYGTQNTAP